MVYTEIVKKVNIEFLEAAVKEWLTHAEKNSNMNSRCLTY